MSIENAVDKHRRRSATCVLSDHVDPITAFRWMQNLAPRSVVYPRKNSHDLKGFNMFQPSVWWWLGFRKHPWYIEVPYEILSCEDHTGRRAAEVGCAIWWAETPRDGPWENLGTWICSRVNMVITHGKKKHSFSFNQIQDSGDCFCGLRMIEVDWWWLVIDCGSLLAIVDWFLIDYDYWLIIDACWY